MVASVVLYTASLIVRLTSISGRSSRGAAGIGLGYAGYAVMALGAYFGGEEVFDLGSGVNHTASLQGGPADFVAVVAAADLKVGEPAKADAKGVPILLVNTGSQVYALHDTCVHLGCSLATGTLKGDSIVCPCHGSQFDLLNGRVINGPATMPQPHHEVRTEGGKIEVRLARQ
jgi:nitrite reductase/ring-hydroxylating ferredoxin subunit